MDVATFLATERAKRTARGATIPPIEVRRMSAVAREWERRWSFVGRTLEVTEGEEGVYLHLVAEWDGAPRRLASLRAQHHDGEVYVRAPNPERHNWKGARDLAKRLDALLPAWRALPVVSGEGEQSVLVRLADIRGPADVAFVVNDLLAVLGA